MVIDRLKNSLNTIPPTLRKFLGMALLVFVIWKLLYHLILYPQRIIDKPLTTSTASLSANVYNRIYAPSVAISKDVWHPTGKFVTQIYINDKKGVSIADSCNGLELHVLYIGFLLCFPGTILRKLVFILSGISIIYFANVLRVTLLAHMGYIEFKYADFAHHYVFKMLIYFLIFLLWVWFGKNQKGFLK